MTPFGFSIGNHKGNDMTPFGFDPVWVPYCMQYPKG